MNHETTIEDLRREESQAEKMRPETKRVQCAHCNGYYDEDEIEYKSMCYECKENLDDYRRVVGQRNYFLSAIEAIRTTADLETIHGLCDWILANYKEEK